MRSKVKPIRRSRSESESEQGEYPPRKGWVELRAVDPKPGELSLARVKWR